MCRRREGSEEARALESRGESPRAEVGLPRAVVQVGTARPAQPHAAPLAEAPAA